MSQTLESRIPLILVVDDDRSTRMILRLILEQDGCEVVDVENGQQCLNAYLARKPDMVLLDAKMPVMDGFTCCAELQKLPLGTSTPILMIAGLEDQASVDKAFAAGAMDYVTKPIHPPILRRRLRHLLEASWAEQAVRDSEARYRSVVDHLKEVIFQINQEGNVTFLNPIWCELTGFSQQEAINHPLGQFVHPEDHQTFNKQIEQLLLNHQSECRFDVRFLHKEGSFGWMEIYACAILGPDDRIVGISGSLADITERKYQEQRFNVEQATTRVLAEVATLSEAFPRLLQAISQSLGWEYGELWLIDESNYSLRCAESWLALRNKTSTVSVESSSVHFALAASIIDRIWHYNRPLWLSDYEMQDAQVRSFQQAGMATTLSFPILEGYNRLGVMFFSKYEPQAKDPSLLNIMGSIGAQLGEFIMRKKAEEEVQRQHAKLQSELNQAAAYVQSLIPPPLSGLISIQHQFIPSNQLGGDAFDYYWLDTDHLAIYLLDVAGHGIRSTLLSVSVLNVVRSQSLLDTDFYQPSSVLDGLNEVFQMNEQGDDYFTIWYGVYNCKTQKLKYASGGHPAVLLAFEQHPVKPLEVKSIPIGMMTGFPYDQYECDIQAGSSLYLFSDGVYEIMQPNGEVWTFDEFISIVSEYQHQQLDSLDPLFQQIQHIAGHKSFDDDYSLMKISFDAA
ncbi:SpoIIE family protein phosphatase [Acaryochloris sp. IP29b_bin.148]|uniref:SpoIIE family protein phosphatase n=1 Tax=Acaryochloris sp. IP29b_bin.148 TaxID=2969218 RepID=UPI002606059C|nr:SpoIIE family protein phosphatase [Acaryochloris sp. IP29b_bin.148]